MRFLKIFTLVILSILFILYSFVFMLNLSLGRTLLNIEHYRNMSEEFDIFSNLHTSLESSFLPEFDESQQETHGEGEFIVYILGEVFDKDWLEEQFFIALGDILAYTKGERETLTAKIDFSDRQELLEERVEDELNMQEGFLPIEADMDEMGQEEDLPSALYLKDLLEDEQNKNIFSKIIMIRTYSPIFSYVILFVFLLLMFLFAGLLGGLKWYGANMLVSGLIFLVFLISLSTALNIEFISNFAEVPEQFAFVLSLFRYTFEQMMVVPIVFSLSGLFLILFSVLLGRMKRRKT